jgi:integrase
MRYSGHALRHTVGTIIERVAGPQVAAQMLGHERKSTTGHYTGADLSEVARVFGAITGSSHPAASE